MRGERQTCFVRLFLLFVIDDIIERRGTLLHGVECFEFVRQLSGEHRECPREELGFEQFCFRGKPD